MFKVMLGNKEHPEYGVATIPFPIKNEEYDAVIELLRPLEIGDAVSRDCLIREISSDYPVLRRLEDTTVNLDELDYLAKRLDGFDEYEKTQFQGMVDSRSYSDITDFINLTFCCQEATIITDFSSLEKIGRNHYMDVNGGMLSVPEETTDFRMEALQLILNEDGVVTPYGVVYDNGMKLAQLYDGRHFPQYSYEPCVMEVEVIPEKLPRESKPSTFLSLPLTELHLERALIRGDCLDGDVELRFIDSRLPKEADAAIDFEREDIAGLNRLCRILSPLTQEDLTKLGAVVAFAEPTTAPELGRVAQHLHLFDFVPGVSTAEEYGRYMIRDSLHFEYDENLADFYDYEKYGRQRMENEPGAFNHRGYVGYHGVVSMEELLAGVPTVPFPIPQEEYDSCHGMLSMDQLMMKDPCEAYRQEQGFQMGGL